MVVCGTCKQKMVVITGSERGRKLKLSLTHVTLISVEQFLSPVLMPVDGT